MPERIVWSSWALKRESFGVEGVACVGLGSLVDGREGAARSAGCGVGERSVLEELGDLVVYGGFVGFSVTVEAGREDGVIEVLEEGGKEGGVGGREGAGTVLVVVQACNFGEG
eukprot:gene13081-27616_t